MALASIWAPKTQTGTQRGGSQHKNLKITCFVNIYYTLATFYCCQRHRLTAYHKMESDGKSIGKVPKVCSWYGVRCLDEDSGDLITKSETGVTELNLSGNQLSGEIFKHLYDMPSLKVVDLKNNQITDARLDGISEGDDGAPLEKLILSENQLTSLSGIENAPSTLEELHVNENDFTKFPHEVFKLHKLKTLMFTHNDGISGPLPTQFGEMKNLRKLLLWYNGFTGTIPTELGNLKKLEVSAGIHWK